jgi:hypothetical protein
MRDHVLMIENTLGYIEFRRRMENGINIGTRLEAVRPGIWWHCIAAASASCPSVAKRILGEAWHHPTGIRGNRKFPGELRNGGTIRIKTTDGGGRILRFQVQQMPGEVMIWTRGLPIGLLKRIRTFTFSPQAGLTHLTVKEEVSGPLATLLGNTRPDTAQTLNDYVGAVSKCAELLDRSS